MEYWIWNIGYGILDMGWIVFMGVDLIEWTKERHLVHSPKLSFLNQCTV